MGLGQDQQQHPAVHNGGVSRGSLLMCLLALVTYDRRHVTNERRRKNASVLLSTHVRRFSVSPIGESLPILCHFLVLLNQPKQNQEWFLLLLCDVSA